MKARIVLSLLILLTSVSLNAQDSTALDVDRFDEMRGIGLRFASNINYFPRALQYNLVPDGFTTGIFGVYYSNYTPKSGYEIGGNIVFKNGGEGFNLPVVMTDFSPDQSLGLGGIEMDLKVGPRFGSFNPKIGYILGYRFYQEGFLRDGATGEVNPWYLMLPLGVSGIWATNFGTVGVGGFYNVGILNVLKNPDPGAGSGSIYDGGRHRYINLEIIVTYGVR
ncbi:MAG: hypothetical protein AAFN10_17565 [Bacteroidota bacterium]